MPHFVSLLRRYAPRYGRGLLRFARNDELKIALVF